MKKIGSIIFIIALIVCFASFAYAEGSELLTNFREEKNKPTPLSVFYIIKAGMTKDEVDEIIGEAPISTNSYGDRVKVKYDSEDDYDNMPITVEVSYEKVVQDNGEVKLILIIVQVVKVFF